MKAWLVHPGHSPEEIEVDRTGGALGVVSDRYFGGATMDMTMGRYNGRLCHIAVDDDGHGKGLLRNEIATQAYLANCYPGTTHWIAGPAVIFDGLLT